MKLKKSQGLSMNVIIIAAIAVIVLVVLVIIFSGKARQFGKGTEGVSEGFEKDVCEIPGVYNRECMDQTQCESLGGTPLSGVYRDCGSSGGPCCEK